MTNYIRRYVPGGTYFFTARLQNPTSDMLVSHIDLLRDATKLCMKRWPFEIAAAVVLPNRMHMIWVLPDGDADFSKRWRLIKSSFSRHVPAPAFVSASQKSRGEKGIWQRRFWEHAIRDHVDYERHMHVIATAPVLAGLVSKASDWPYCSLHQRKMGLDPSLPKTTAPVRLRPDPPTAARASETVVIDASEGCRSHAGFRDCDAAPWLSGWTRQPQ